MKETITDVLACRHWAPLWKDSKVLFCTDNKTAMVNIVKGSCRDHLLLPWVRELHVYSVLCNFEISAC